MRKRIFPKEMGFFEALNRIIRVNPKGLPKQVVKKPKKK